MMTKNKTELIKQIRTSVRGSTVVFLTGEPGTEIARLNTANITDQMTRALVIYGTKQICSDMVAALPTVEKKMAGIQRAIESLGAGVWPTQRTLEAAAASLAAVMGISVEDLLARLED